ncbi:MAG: S24 family peptidase [Alphaproteobacteria bacterium]
MWEKAVGNRPSPEVSMVTKLVRELRRRMETGGFNQKSLARAAGLNETAVRDILIGKSKHPRHDTIEKLAGALGCSLVDLLAPGTGDKPRPAAPVEGELAFVPTYEVSAAAGGGIVIDVEHESGHLAFRHDWLRSVTAAPLDQLAVITVRGDSMYPTLADGDTILVDLAQRTPARDGIYVIRFGDFLLVKRLALDPVRRLVTISCDNENYPPLAPVEPADVEVAGRVIWVGRRL